MSKIGVLIVGHEVTSPLLPEWARYIRRKSDARLNHDMNSQDVFTSTGLAWSEYAAWFENSKILDECEVKGLAHYRCVLNLYKFNLGYLPVFARYIFLKIQAHKYKKISNVLIVGVPNKTKYSVLDQFSSSHPESIEILMEACKIYDELIGIGSKQSILRLEEMVEYFPRSIFLTDSNFYSDWLRYSYEIARELDKCILNFPNNRWGGFVLERIFTLFVLDYSRSSNLKIIEAEQVYFLTNSEWMKRILLKVKFIKKLSQNKN